MDELLNNLIGRWSLTGKMGDTALYQKVNAKWVLRELFVEMRFSPQRVGEGGNPDYEALYLIEYDKKTGEYVLHLFDTFGVTSKPVPGIGTRKSDHGSTPSPGIPAPEAGRTISHTNRRMEARQLSQRKN